MVKMWKRNILKMDFRNLAELLCRWIAFSMRIVQDCTLDKVKHTPKAFIQ
jgi:hypothetical protein